MAAFALRATYVVFTSYTLSGILLVPPVLVALGLRWRIDRSLIVPMIGWGAAALVGFDVALKAITA